jgi:ribulose-phosphate 3-epimerase
MIEIIPAILAKDIKELRSQIKKIAHLSNWVHLDVMDGKFVPNLTWNNPQEVDFGKFNFKTEVHLMVSEPLKALSLWLKTKVRRLIFSFEALKVAEREKIFPRIIKRTLKAGKEIGFALDPDTPLKELEPFLPFLNLVQLMAVKPGFAGQPFQEKVFKKIKDLRSQNKKVLISVDGGVNDIVAPKLIKAGVNILVSHSFIFESENPQKAIERLKGLS